MSPNLILVLLSLTVVLSYVVELFSNKAKVPSVLILLLLGILLKQVLVYYQVELNITDTLLPILGTVGLILIVFEGALELKYDKNKNTLILKALFSALLILILTTVTIGLILQFITSESLHTCLVNAVPFSVISSAVAIPSAKILTETNREFIIYESSFSDIFAIILFNFLSTNSTINSKSFMFLGYELLGVIAISLIFCFGLLYLLKQLRLKVRFILILSVLMLVYGLGKMYHLSSLIIVLFLGLFLANVDKINITWIQQRFMYSSFTTDFDQLHQISLEGAFLIRTFFFLLFGLSININDIISLNVIQYGIIVLISIYLIRVVYLLITDKASIFPNVFMAPRGLISILLFFNIPTHYNMNAIESGLLFLVVLFTCILMSIGILIYSNSTKNI